MTDNFDLFKDPDGLDWFVATTIVRDPQFLTPMGAHESLQEEGDGTKLEAHAVRRALSCNQKRAFRKTGRR